MPDTNGHAPNHFHPAANPIPPRGQKFVTNHVDGQATLNTAFVAALENLAHNALTSRADWLRKLGDPRRSIDDECGYPKGQISLTEYVDMYDREPVAARVVEVMPAESWQVQPTVYEDEDEANVTAFEQAWDDLGKTLAANGGTSWHQDELGSPVWSYLRRADILSRIGQFGVLFMGFDDGQDLSMPVPGSVELPEGLDPSEATQDQNSPTPLKGVKPKLPGKKGSPGVGMSQVSGVGTAPIPEPSVRPDGFTRKQTRPKQVRNAAGVDKAELKRAAGRVAKSGLLMPGYGQVFVKKGTGQVWYVGGDGDEDGTVKLVNALFKRVIGVETVRCEAEYFPPKDGTWEQVYPVSRAARRAAKPDSPATNAEIEALRKLPNLTENETLVINHLETQAHDAHTRNRIAEVKDIVQSPTGSLAGTDAQYFGVIAGPSELPGSKATKNDIQLLFLRAFSEDLVQVVRYEWDVRNPRFGQPVMYRVTFNDPRTVQSGVGLPLATLFVHWSRVIHIADTSHHAKSSEIFAAPVMMPVFNRLMDIRKTSGAAGEGYFRGGTPGLILETPPTLGGDVVVDAPGLRDQVENFQNGFQKVLQLTALSAKIVSPSVADPSPFITAFIQQICIKLGIPMRVFMGSERGELASSQDDASWNDRLKHRQMFYITPRIIIPFIDRLILVGVLPEPDFVPEPKVAPQDALDTTPPPGTEGEEDATAEEDVAASGAAPPQDDATQTVPKRPTVPGKVPTKNRYTFDAEDCPKCGASMEGDPYSGKCNSCGKKWGKMVINVFCPTGEGGGSDPSCSPKAAHEMTRAEFQAAHPVRRGDMEDYVKAYTSQYKKGKPGSKTELSRPDGSGEAVHRDDSGKVVAVVAFTKDAITDLAVSHKARGQGHLSKLLDHVEKTTGVVHIKGPYTPAGAAVAHRRSVKSALKSGMSVPAHVLKEYPGLTTNAFPPKKAMDRPANDSAPTDEEDGDGTDAPDATETDGAGDPKGGDASEQTRPIGYRIDWPDLDSTTENDKATIANTRITAIAAYVSGGVDAMIPPLDFLTKIMQFDVLEAKEMLAAADAAAQQAADEQAALAEEHGLTPVVPGCKDPNAPPPPEPLKPGESPPPDTWDTNGPPATNAAARRAWLESLLAAERGTPIDPPTINPLVSDQQRKACYAKDDPAWDCDEWENATKGKTLPKKAKKLAKVENLFLLCLKSGDVTGAHRVVNQFCPTGDGGGVDPSCGEGGGSPATPQHAPDPKVLEAGNEKGKLHPNVAVKTDKEGNKWVVKNRQGKAKDVENESTAAKLAKIAGVDVPPVHPQKHNGGDVAVVPHVEGKPLTAMSPDERRAAVAKVPKKDLDNNALFDYALGNGDPNAGNYMIRPNGKMVAIDKEATMNTTVGKGNKSDFHPPGFLEYAVQQGKPAVSYEFDRRTMTEMSVKANAMADELEKQGKKKDAVGVRRRAAVMAKVAAGDRPPTAQELDRAGREYDKTNPAASGVGGFLRGLVGNEATEHTPLIHQIDESKIF